MQYSARAQLIGLKAKIYAKKRHAEKVTMKRTIAEHSERDNRHKAEEAPKGAVPHYLLDREQARGARRDRRAAWELACAAAPPPLRPCSRRRGPLGLGLEHTHMNSASPRRPRARCGTLELDRKR